MVRDSRSLPAPSWPRVIATTLRLWVQRHVLPARQDEHASRRPSRRALIAALVIVVAAGAVGAVAVAHSGGTDQTPSDRTASNSAPLSSGALAAAAVSRRQAATWVEAQVSHGVILACDPLMCAALQQRGFPVADLAPIGPAAGDPLGSGLVISTMAVRSQLGARLARVYAPVVIASFGTGTSLIQVRVTAAGGSAAYLAALRADLTARTVAGRELAGKKDITVGGAARTELISGRVDSRLLITLAALADRFPVRITGFADAGPGAGASGPLRQLTVAAPTARYLHWLTSFLRGQRPPLLASVSERHLGQTTIVQINFTAPSPTGLLSTSASQ